MKQHDIQLDKDGQLRHFLTIEGLKKTHATRYFRPSRKLHFSR